MKKSLTINGKLITKYFRTKKEMDSWLFLERNKLHDKSLNGEVWISIPDFSRYEASNLGRVRSLNYKNSGIIKVIKPCENKDGYLKSVLLSDQGIYRNTLIHRAVCIAFKDKKGKNEINHINGIKNDNHIRNLEWVTHSENCKHAIDNGLWVARTGELNGMAKLTKEQVFKAREMKRNGGRYWGRNKLAKELGISAKHLQFIVNNEDITWHKN